MHPPWAERTGGACPPPRAPRRTRARAELVLKVERVEEDKQGVDVGGGVQQLQLLLRQEVHDWSRGTERAPGHAAAAATGSRGGGALAGWSSVPQLGCVQEQLGCVQEPLELGLEGLGGRQGRPARGGQSSRALQRGWAGSSLSTRMHMHRRCLCSAESCSLFMALDAHGLRAALPAACGLGRVAAIACCNAAGALKSEPAAQPRQPAAAPRFARPFRPIQR